MIREPFVPTEGIHNFRDYGGWQVSGGGHVRSGLLYRSGQHVGASDADLAAIDALDIRTVIDLRGTSERERNPCRRGEGFAAEVIAHDGETSSSPPHMDVDADTTTAQFARQRMIAVYTRMPRNPAMIAMFGRYFRALDQRDGASLVHCFAGKDRTGVAAMLLLHVLGASEEDQLAEFLRTNQAPTISVLREQSVPGIEQRLGRKLEEDAIRALLEVHEDYLATYRKEVARDHGSLDAYLETVIGVDEPMRERLHTRLVA
ncbi:protein tyrosine phosphatase [Erythrobacter sp. QSSC1-22B]|uniref:tyrosine-protein phosphatase n=1 Tax=Erythrobacter sp. QSSC1-22B TaxID=1860125 RepID=UPI0008055E58|nr:tyrosine-protein phosphatase [Erythrobacter sp. QSSC1-22B]OBX20692.1 protein tyrosine phosphatase [Erythrobacter sp. QSSC1-22B]